MPVVLHGITESGKTAFAAAHFEQPLVVRRRDDLKKIGVKTDGVIFDDIDFSAWAPEEIICLLDFDMTRSIAARYADAIIPAEMPLIFTTDKKPKKMFPRAESSRVRAAIKRRYVSVEINAPLQALGRPFSREEKRARLEAGRGGPQGPGVQ